MTKPSANLGKVAFIGSLFVDELDDLVDCMHILFLLGSVDHTDNLVGDWVEVFLVNAVKQRFDVAVNDHRRVVLQQALWISGQERTRRYSGSHLPSTVA